MERYPAIVRHITLLFTLAGLTGCSGEVHVSPPNTPKNLSATFWIDIFGGEYVNLHWEDTNWSNDIGFTVYRDGDFLAVVNPECLAWDDLTCHAHWRSGRTRDVFVHRHVIIRYARVGKGIAKVRQYWQQDDGGDDELDIHG